MNKHFIGEKVVNGRRLAGTWEKSGQNQAFSGLFSPFSRQISGLFTPVYSRVI
jgi:hypothetical protein